MAERALPPLLLDRDEVECIGISANGFIEAVNMTGVKKRPNDAFYAYSSESPPQFAGHPIDKIDVSMCGLGYPWHLMFDMVINSEIVEIDGQHIIPVFNVAVFLGPPLCAWFLRTEARLSGDLTYDPDDNPYPHGPLLLAADELVEHPRYNQLAEELDLFVPINLDRANELVRALDTPRFVLEQTLGDTGTL